MMVFVLATMMLLSGCSLAIEGAGVEGSVSQDRLIGAFITEEYLRAVDEEEKLYATVDKHDSTVPADWEVTFGDVEGICFFNVKWEEEEEGPFSMLICGDEMSEVHRNLSVTDEGENVELTGTIYALIEKEGEEHIFHMNPVFQTPTGEIYALAGMGYHMSSLGPLMKTELEEKTTLTENGKTVTYSGAVEVAFEVLNYPPAKIRLQFMNENLDVIKVEEFAAGEVPTEIAMVENAVCLIIETEWEDGTVTRELFEPKENVSACFDTFYQISDITLGKQMTEIVWK